MSPKQHHYAVAIEWTGNLGSGTQTYTGYKRAHEIRAENKPSIPCSSDPAFRGDTSRYNPEELLVASLSSCHMLWYLHLCADSGIVVATYADHATGRMVETADGGGRFEEVMLRPRTGIQGKYNSDLAKQLHEKAHHLCFIANSVNFPVRCEPEFYSVE
jgi:organic hydroperoxide reductase OsmC/OhrA